MSFELRSRAFKNNGDMPSLYTCEGRNMSPPLAWADVPGGAKTLALIVDDPDAPDPAAAQTTFVHWLLFNIPPNVNGIEENARPAGAVVGHNDYGHNAYDGPCPPIGKHRYMFKLYALDANLNLDRDTTKARLEEAMRGHILGQTLLIGTYQKRR